MTSPNLLEENAPQVPRLVCNGDAVIIDPTGRVQALLKEEQPKIERQIKLSQESLKKKTFLRNCYGRSITD